jgi:hypothetical protein
MDCASISIIAERIDLRLVPARTLIKRMQREESALFSHVIKVTTNCDE